MISLLDKIKIVEIDHQSFEGALPSKVGTNDWNSASPLDASQFRVGLMVDEKMSKKFKGFKDDLKRNALDLKEKKGAISTSSKWSLQYISSGKEKSRFPLVGDSEGRSTMHFSPKDATFLYLKILLDRLVLSFPEAPVNIYISIPAYSNAKSAAMYRKNLAEILDDISEPGGVRKENYKDVNFFASGAHNFVYEPYAVFYYFSLYENLVDFKNDAGKTYLTFDMGGSTTDLALVQVQQSGASLKTYPKAISIEKAGVNFDEHLLDYLQDRPQNLWLKRLCADPTDKAKALEAVELLKIETISNDEEIGEIRYLENTLRIDREKLISEFQNWWNIKGGLKSMVVEFLKKEVQDADNKSSNMTFLDFNTVEKVFISGGASQMLGIETLICEAINEALGNKEKSLTESEIIRPQLTMPHAVTALGLACAVIERKKRKEDREISFQSSEEVYGLIVDDLSKKPLGFKARSSSVNNNFAATLDNSNKLPQYAIKFLPNNLTYEKGEWPYTDVPMEVTEEGFGEKLLIKLSTSGTEESFKDAPALEIPLKSGQEFKNLWNRVKRRPTLSKAELKFKHTEPEIKLGPDGDINFKLKPAFFLSIPGTQQEKLIHDVEYTKKISLEPEQFESKNGEINVCIDFGMSNTSIAVISQDQYLENNNGVKFVPASELVRNRNLSESIKTPIVDIKEPAVIKKGDVTDAIKTESSTEPKESPSSDDQIIAEIQNSQNEIQAIETRKTDKTIYQLHLDNSIEEKLKRWLDSQNIENKSAKGLPNFVKHLDKTASDIVAKKIEATNSNKGHVPIYNDFVEFVKSKDLIYKDSVLKTVWSQTFRPDSKLTILAGPPGTGKTKLPLIMGEYLNQVFPLGEDNKHSHLLLQVAPNWYSSKKLFGGYNELTDNFMATDFLKLCILADFIYQKESISNQDIPPTIFFACLDEFNLAHPEQYMAEVLSAIEARYEENGRTITLKGRSDEDSLKFKLSPNLKIFATVNIDATTKALSSKVLDRSVFVRVSPDESMMDNHLKGLIEKTDMTELEKSIIELLRKTPQKGKSLLSNIYKLSMEAMMPLGFRVIDNMMDFVKYYPDKSVDSEELMDELLQLFIYPKFPSIYAVRNNEYKNIVDQLSSNDSELNSWELTKYPSVKGFFSALKAGKSGQSV
jgi:hypothetical protein